MARLTQISRRAILERAHKRRKKQRVLPAILLVAIGVVLTAAAWYLLAGRSSAQTEFEYSSEDVVYDHPLTAVHEMEPPNLASIPFLPNDGPQPKISVSEDFYNLGSIGPTDVVTHDFMIANLGEAPLTINRAYTTCGCTTADLTATVIPPGKVSVVTMRLDAGFHDVRGQTVRRGIIIENNDPKNPQVEIWAQAAVRRTP
jgi:hypothetical protein